jgi:hypothetical protein
MKSQTIRLLLCALLVAVAGCRARTDESEGTVILSVSDFDGLPVGMSVTAGPFSIGEVTLSNIPKSASSPSSELQTIEIRSYEVTYRRLDTGTRTPPPLVEGLFGNVAVNGTTNYANLPYIRSAQLVSQPLADLALLGRDSETGSTVIPLRVTLRFFGRTIAGDDIASQPASFDIEVVP